MAIKLPISLSFYSLNNADTFIITVWCNYLSTLYDLINLVSDYSLVWVHRLIHLLTKSTSTSKRDIHLCEDVTFYRCYVLGVEKRNQKEENRKKNTDVHSVISKWHIYSPPLPPNIHHSLKRKKEVFLNKWCWENWAAMCKRMKQNTF